MHLFDKLLFIYNLQQIGFEVEHFERVSSFYKVFVAALL